MGLGGGPGEWDDYEWVRLADLPPSPAPPPVRRAGPPPLADAVLAGLARRSLWTTGAGTRVLLVDLDNLRADPTRWRDRMAMVVALARQADVAALAGQDGAVRRARPHLAEFAPRARAVADGSDLADHVLLDAAAEVPGAAQFVVLSNDWIFAGLAGRGPLTVLSPGGDALSDRLRDAATRVVDLAAVEATTVEAATVEAATVRAATVEAATGPGATAQGAGRGPRRAAFRASRRRRSAAPAS